MLTRELLQSEDFLDAFDDLPGQPRWPRERITASLQVALAARPAGESVWLFAYGSLIWNPLFRFEEQRPALLDGWQRRFCLKLLSGRASAQTPGRMLALAEGGECAGVAFRLAERDLHEELKLVWIREMIYGSYRPIWASVQLPAGTVVSALVFAANPALPQYVTDSTIESTARLIANARGPLGSNLDYLLRLDATLTEHGLRDPYIHELAQVAQAAAMTHDE